MPAGVILDTSFLITLANPDHRPNHEVAHQYWKHFAEQSIPIFLPTIVVSEFHIRQEIPPYILKACILLPFNWDDAVKAATLDFSAAPRKSASRDAIKDDVKVIAQAIVKDAGWIITEDSQSLVKFVARLRNANQCHCRTILLSAGFDRSFLDPNGQRQMTYETKSESNSDQD